MFLRDTSDILNRTAIIDAFGNQFTYGELETLSLEYKKFIPERSLVMILCDYSVETVAFYYCQMTNHVVPILVDKNLDNELLLRLIKTYEPQFIWCWHGIMSILPEQLPDIVIQREAHVLIHMSFERCNINPKLALLLTTSGSTGSSKLVRLSYKNLRSNSEAFAASIGLHKNDRGITTMPMHYCFGLSVLHMHWIYGACIYITEYSMINIKFWNFFEDSNITNFFGVPYTFDMLKQIDFLEKEYNSLRFLLLGGGKLSNELQIEFGKKLREKNIKFYIGYGQTEATTCISTLSYKKVEEKLGSIGRPLSGINISVENPNEKDEGELVCTSQSVSLGYAVDKRDLARGDDNAGCLYTGDIVYVDEEGDIFIKGRKSRFVKILGARVSLDELETILMECFTNVQFACVGKDNKIRIYYSKKGIEKDILQFCKKKISIPRKMVECYFINELPYLSNGKVNYKDLEI